MSCSEEDEPIADGGISERSVTRGDEITYDVTTSDATRAEEQPCHFVMSALLKDSSTPSDSYGSLFIDHDMVEDLGTCDSHRWVDYTARRYWPTADDATLDFYIHASTFEHADGGRAASQASEIDWTDGRENFSPSLKVFVSDEGATQEDLLYATAFGQKRHADGRAMPLNVEMRHAMTQVLFDARLCNETLHVEISDISLCGTPLGAYFRFPTSAGANASWEIPDHTDNAVDIHISAMTVGDDGISLPFTPTADLRGISYENADGALRAAKGKEMKVIPGRYKRGRYVAGMWCNVYLKVTCAVWNVAQAGSFNRDSDYLLVGTRDGANGEVRPATVYIPIDWGTAESDGSLDLGKCYIYTLSFGTGNAAKSADGRNIPHLAECSARVSDWID